MTGHGYSKPIKFCKYLLWSYIYWTWTSCKNTIYILLILEHNVRPQRKMTYWGNCVELRSVLSSSSKLWLELRNHNLKKTLLTRSWCIELLKAYIFWLMMMYRRGSTSSIKYKLEIIAGYVRSHRIAKVRFLYWCMELLYGSSMYEFVVHFICSLWRRSCYKSDIVGL